MPRTSVFLLAACLLLGGCMLEQEISRTPRTAVEQLLLTQAVQLALNNMTVSLPEHSRVLVEVTGLHSDRALISQPGLNLFSQSQPVLQGGTLDLVFIRDAVVTALARRGYSTRGVAFPNTNPDYVARVIVESWGTTQGLTFFGMPPVQSVVIPFSLPELTIYKYQQQHGYGRLHIDFFDNKDGGYLGSTATLIGRTYYHQYTVLFFVTWIRTDLTAPP